MDKQRKKERKNRLHGRRFVVVVAVLAAAILLLNMALTYRIASGQAEQIGRMRVQNIAANYQRSLTRSENVLERLGAGGRTGSDQRAAGRVPDAPGGGAAHEKRILRTPV